MLPCNGGANCVKCALERIPHAGFTHPFYFLGHIAFKWNILSEREGFQRTEIQIRKVGLKCKFK